MLPAARTPIAVAGVDARFTAVVATVRHARGNVDDRGSGSELREPRELEPGDAVVERVDEVDVERAARRTAQRRERGDRQVERREPAGHAAGDGAGRCGRRVGDELRDDRDRHHRPRDFGFESPVVGASAAGGSTGSVSGAGGASAAGCSTGAPHTGHATQSGFGSTRLHFAHAGPSLPLGPSGARSGPQDPSPQNGQVTEPAGLGTLQQRQI
jgi:hypothetical protein